MAYTLSDECPAYFHCAVCRSEGAFLDARAEFLAEGQRRPANRRFVDAIRRRCARQLRILWQRHRLGRDREAAALAPPAANRQAVFLGTAAQIDARAARAAFDRHCDVPAVQLETANWKFLSGHQV